MVSALIADKQRIPAKKNTLNIAEANSQRISLGLAWPTGAESS